MRQRSREEVVRRLKSVEGHVRGVARMVDEGDVSYAEIVQQTSAVFSAIKRINALLLKDYVEEKVEPGGISEETLKEVLKAIDKGMK